MPIKTYAQWFAISDASGAAGLSEITDAISDTDPAGTSSNKAYWEAHAYDVFEAMFDALGSNPGTGIDGNVFTVNQDAVSAVSQRLEFNHGGGGDRPFWRWNHTADIIEFSRDLEPYNLGNFNLGASGNRLGTIYADTVNATTLLGAISATGSDADSFTIDTDDTIHTAGTGSVKYAVSRGGDGDSALEWSEDDDVWKADDGSVSRQIVRVSDTDTVNVAMFDGDIYAGTGGDFGAAATIARSDHNHAAGSTTATGTSETVYTLDDDWIATDAVDITLAFGPVGTSGRKIFIQPDAATPLFTFTDGLISDTHNTDDIGTDLVRWKDFYLEGNADIDGSLNVEGEATFQAGSILFNTDVLTLDADSTIFTTGLGYVNLRVIRGLSPAVNLRWSEEFVRWEYTLASGASHPIASTTQAQTLTNKTLTSPVLTAGSWTGNPVLSGNPTLSGNPSFTGTPNFTANASVRPAFTITPGFAPFTVTSNLAASVTNLDSDKLDGLHASVFFRHDGSINMSGTLSTNGNDIDLGGGDLLNAGSLTVHQASHLAGGSDPLTGGALDSGVTGVQGLDWRIGTNSPGAAVGELLYLGSQNLHFITKTSLSAVGLGGSDIDIVPGAASANQDVGQTGRRWRNGFFNNMIALQELSSATPATPQNGSVWVTDASVGNGSLSKYRVQLQGTALTVIDHNNKTAMVGSTGNFAIGGLATITSGSITGVSITGITDLAVADGGTGASTAAGARANLGLSIGSNVQAWDADLDAIAALAKSDSNFIVGNGSTWVAESGATVRTSLGLGSLAEQNSINDSNWSGTDLAVINGGTGASDITTARSNLGAAASVHTHSALDITTQTLPVIRGGTGGNSVLLAQQSLSVQPGADVQAFNTHLLAIADMLKTNGNFIVGNGTTWVAESGSTARTSLGLGALAIQNSVNDSDWSGSDLGVVNGGTGASTAANARSNLGLAIGSNVQAYSDQLTNIAALSPTDSNFIVGNGTTWVAESGATARASLDAAALSHNHSALDITTQTLPVIRGGTGGNSILLAQQSLDLEPGVDILPLSGGTLTGTLNMDGNIFYLKQNAGMYFEVNTSGLGTVKLYIGSTVIETWTGIP